MDDDDIVFDRDTSAPKKKLKDRKRRKGKSNGDINAKNLKKIINNSDIANTGDKNINNNNKKKDDNSNENQILNTGKMNINNTSNNDLNLGKNNKKDKNDVNDKNKSQKDDLVNFNIKDSNQFNSNNSFNNANLSNINNLNDKSQNMDGLNSSLNNKNNYDLNQNDLSYNKNVSLSQGNENLNDSNIKSKLLDNNKNNSFNNNSKNKEISLNDKEAFLKEFNSAMKSGDKDRIIIVLKRKIEILEYNLNDLNLIIQHLRKDIHNKENVLHLLTDTNTNLKISLNKFSKQLDEKILEANKKPKKKLDIYSKSLSTIFAKKNLGINSKNLKNDEDKKYTEIDNVLAMNKILQKDNENLKNLLNSYGNVDKMKELENLNKMLKDQNNNLNEEITKLKKELLEHSYCEKKRNRLLEQIRYLTEENKRLKNDIKKITSPINDDTSRKIKDNNTSNSTQNFSNTINNNNKGKIMAILRSPRLPKISKNKTTLEFENDKLNKNLKNNKIKDEELENLTDKDEIYILIQLFQGDKQKYEEFRKKIIIYAKSKESIINKYILEEKCLNKKVFSMQEQVEYLNHKVKESEMRIKVFQQQLNDSNFQNKKLKKKYNEEKKEKENTKQILNDFKKRNEEIKINRIKIKNKETNVENDEGEENDDEDYEVEENENEND